MPVDTTGKTPARRPKRPVTEEEQKDIEFKRLRGELSCAECRRLKLKCDKSLPCGSCVRRGCESICPLGNLSAGQGTRFILADTNQLHAKIAEMSQRIRQLEEALAILQAVVSNERHPLLATDLLSIKFAAEAPIRPDPPAPEQAPAIIDALGTLTLGNAGEVKYFGRSAGSETLLIAEDCSDDEESASDTESSLPQEIAEIGDVFPSGRQLDSKLQQIRTILPPYARAVDLCEVYLAHGALFFRPIKRNELLGPCLQAIYGPDAPEANKDAPHALAMLFFILALGALLDLRLPPYNAEAERFYGAGRSALGLHAVYDSPLVDTVRAIGLMATYHTHAGKKYSRNSAWCLMSVAAKLAQSIGLHRDSARWYVEQKTVQMRRTLFWEVFAADVSHSLALGRPPAIHLSYVDCEYPEDEESTVMDDGKVRPGFWHSKYHFSRDIWMALAEATLAARPPGYATVLELDRRVRELSMPDSYKPYPTRADGEEQYYSSAASLRAAYAGQYRAVTMIYLHRSFFAQTMLDFPSNPLRSPFATSFLTAYRSASVIIKATAHQFDRNPEMAMRVWFILHQTFSAAIIAGTVVTLSPKSNFASSALLDLGLAVDLFERSAKQSHRAKLALAVLTKLKERAMHAYSQSAPTSGPTSEANTDASPDGAVANELAIFGGQTRVLALKHKQRRAKPGSASRSGTGSTADTPSPNADLTESLAGPAVGEISGARDEFQWLDDLVAANMDVNMDDATLGSAAIPKVR
ncbi:fungal-specific transcription factor domain-containing protein [Mycena sanguinolenta]|nr:fungal-specific transcription factor domain-containing protein [Mycena sanguinolenta]